MVKNSFHYQDWLLKAGNDLKAAKNRQAIRYAELIFKTIRDRFKKNDSK